MAQKGGARPGAGRKPKDEKFRFPIAAAEKRIADRLPELIDYMFELAEGVEVQETDRTGKEKTYTRPPDREAIKYLVDRIMGKPVDRKEIEGGENDVTIKIEYASNDQSDSA